MATTADTIQLVVQVAAEFGPTVIEFIKGLNGTVTTTETLAEDANTIQGDLDTLEKESH